MLMPLRSPKMNSFIFGFQRLTWWPKWTPASSNSFIVTVTAKLKPPLQVIGFVYSPRPHGNLDRQPTGAGNGFKRNDER
jgi:hypothetical protein